MDTFGFHDKHGRSTFHFLYNSYIDEFEVHHRDLITALPDELIAASAPEIHKLFQDNNRHLDSSIVEVIEQLGKAIIANPISSAFFYTEEVLKNNEMFFETFKSILYWNLHFIPQSGFIYTGKNSPVEHYIIHLKLQRYRLFFPNAFKKEIVPISFHQMFELIPKDKIESILYLLDGFPADYFFSEVEEMQKVIFAIRNQQLLFCYST